MSVSKYRIGKDITIKMSVLTNGEPVSLDGRDISLMLKTPMCESVPLDFTTEGNVITTKYEGIRHKYCGMYMITVWENYGKIGQTALDFCNAFELVSYTCGEVPSSEGLELETVDLEGNLAIGVQGRSAYEIAVANGFQGTEEQWLASLKGEKGDQGDPFTFDDFTPEQIQELQRPAADATNAANQAAQAASQAAQTATETAGTATAAAESANQAAGKADAAALKADTAAQTASQTEASIKQAEALRATAEQQRAANEADRKQAESDRQQAEQSRVSAEQERVSAESSRVSAEQDRVVAEQQRVTEFATLKKESETATTNANEAAGKVTQVIDNILLKTEQELTSKEKDQIQSNIGVKNTIDFCGVKEKVSITKDSDYFSIGFRRPTGEIGNDQNYKTYRAIPVTKGSLIVITMTAATSVSALSEVSQTNEFKRMLIGGINIQPSEIKYYLADKDMYIEISANISGSRVLNVEIIPNDIFSHIVKPGGIYRELYEAVGAVYNEETGYYELNGLTDITEDQMRLIYSTGISTYYSLYLDMAYYSSKVRTNIWAKRNQQGNTAGCVLSMRAAFANNNTIEVITLNGDAYPEGTISRTFYDCKNLKKIIGGAFSISKITTYGMADTFYNCKELEEIKLSSIMNFNRISFGQSPKLNYESLKYMIDKAKNTQAVPIIVNATTYSYLMGTVEPTEQVGGTTEEWQALVTAAAEKQITFITE